MIITLRNLDDTTAIAARIADAARPGDVISLSGDLGSGKTAFARAFIRHLTSVDEDVPSPTFTLVQQYDAAHRGEDIEIWHADLYRLEDPEEVLELGLEDAFAYAITLVEWPERYGRGFPAKALQLTFVIDDDGERKLTIQLSDPWRDRLTETVTST